MRVAAYVADMNEARIAAELHKLNRPGWVRAISTETGLDATGDAAVWIFVVVDETPLDRLWPAWLTFRETLREAVERASSSDVITYIRMRDEVEAKGPGEVAA